MALGLNGSLPPFIQAIVVGAILFLAPGLAWTNRSSGDAIVVLFRAVVTSLIAALAMVKEPEITGREQAASHRVAFRVTTIEKVSGKERTVSEALIEGPEGTDFNLTLNTRLFSMAAGFLTDLTAEGQLRVRANIETKRLYGESERHLPLYEIDQRREAFTLGFDEQVVLLPFGLGGLDEQLRMQIVPQRSTQTDLLPDGKRRPLEITILKQSPGGQINISASKVPHRFMVEADLLEEGKVIARTRGAALLKEAGDLLLEGIDRSAEQPSQIRMFLTIDELIRSRPADNASISFSLEGIRSSGPAEPIAKNWAGVCELGKPLTYDLTRYYRGTSGKKYELKINVRLAPGEPVD